MPITATRWRPRITVSIRMPPSLRPIGQLGSAGSVVWPMASRSSRSLGHFSPSRAGWPGLAGSSASTKARPTASDIPDQSAGASGSASEKVSDAPTLDCQALPWRPRPWLWCSATSKQGARSAGVDAGGNALPARRARSSNSVLVEPTLATTSTRRPGNSGASRACRAPAPQFRLGVLGMGRGGAALKPGPAALPSFEASWASWAFPASWARASCPGRSWRRSGTQSAF